MTTQSTEHFNLWKIGSQALQLDFQGGTLVQDAGLLAVRALERPLGILKDLAELLPDPRSPKFIRHSKEALLTQSVYQILAGYEDCNDANPHRHDPLFQILADLAPDPEQPLAGTSTLARFQYAFTRRDAELPLEERPALLDMRAAQLKRVQVVNDYLIDLFVRTRRTAPGEVVLDIDASDDPVHGRQTLSGYHGYFEQHQYFPVFVFDGPTGMPLGAWLRPGTVHASCGAVQILEAIVTRLRAVWPEVPIRLRADNGFGVPAVYEFCEQNDLQYAIGYASNPVLVRATQAVLDDLLIYYQWYQHREPHVQHFGEVRHYQADSWPHPRRVVVKWEITPQGHQRRFVVTNCAASAPEIYQGFYVQRGAVPEQPLGELKNGLKADRLSACGFCANAFRLLQHVVAYALVVLFREATAAIEEVATASVSTLRELLWKVPAVVVSGVRRVALHLASNWPARQLWARVWAAVNDYLTGLGTRVGDGSCAEWAM
jgi:hypothetical protein